MRPNVVKTFLISIIGLSAIFIGMLIVDPIIQEHEEAHRFDFHLNTADGPIALEDYRGKSVALYFGYTYCPDVCPTSLTALAEALSKLTVQEQQSFQGIFVSVDPERDTLAHIKEYALYFHDHFVGATSQDKEYLHQLVKRYGGSFRKVDLKGSQMGYSVNHTSDIYLFNKEGKFTAKIPHLAKQEDIITALKKAL